jgi:hypothetical protein
MLSQPFRQTQTQTRADNQTASRRRATSNEILAQRGKHPGGIRRDPNGLILCCVNANVMRQTKQQSTKKRGPRGRLPITRTNRNEL